MHHRGDELHLLGHALGEFLHLFLPPVLDAEAHEPLLQFPGGVAHRHAFQLGQVQGLVPHLHLAVQATLLRQVADPRHVCIGDAAAVEKDLARGGDGDPVHNPDGRGLAGAVGAQQAVNLALRDIDAHMVQGDFLAEGLADVPYLNQSHIYLNAK